MRLLWETNNAPWLMVIHCNNYISTSIHLTALFASTLATPASPPCLWNKKLESCTLFFFFFLFFGTPLRHLWHPSCHRKRWIGFSFTRPCLWSRWCFALELPLMMSLIYLHLGLKKKKGRKFRRYQIVMGNYCCFRMHSRIGKSSHLANV